MIVILHPTIATRMSCRDVVAFLHRAGLVIDTRRGKSGRTWIIAIPPKEIT